MSDPLAVHGVFYVMKKEDLFDQEFILQNTDAVDLVQPYTTPYAPAITQFVVGDELLQFLDAVNEQSGFPIQIIPVFPYKFELNVSDFDIKAVDTWFDGVPRIRGGTVSLLSNSTFVTVWGIHHEQQVERAVETFDAIVGGQYDRTFGGWNGAPQLENEVHFKDLRGTALAHRLTKTVVLQVKIWWLYRITIFRQL